MIGPDVVPTHIIHDDSADLHRADLHLISDLFWMGRLTNAPTWCACCGYTHSEDDDCPDTVPKAGVASSDDCDACGGSRVFHGELCPQCT